MGNERLVSHEGHVCTPYVDCVTLFYHCYKKIQKIMRAASETSKKLIKGYGIVLCGFLLNGQMRPQESLYPAARYKNRSAAEKSNSNFL